MISIIVPVYKVEEYLRQCVDSILRQTCKDFELILVDDGSPDGCPAICDAYAAKDDRVRVIHKPNGGLMSAWKAGFAAARGEHIGFVDSDDWIDVNMYETLLEALLRHDADVVCAAYIREYDDRSEREQVFLPGGLYDRKRIESDIYPKLISKGTMLDRGLAPNRVTKLFKAELLRNNVAFCDERVSLGEDLVTTFACMCDAQRIYVMDDFFPYHYCIRGTSIMGSYNPRFYDQAVLLNDTLSDIARQKNVYDFSLQLDNDLVSLAYYGMERNLACADAQKPQLLAFIRQILTDSRFLAACERETLSQNNKKCRAYRILAKRFGEKGLYGFIRYIVLFKRRYFGY